MENQPHLKIWKSIVISAQDQLPAEKALSKLDAWLNYGRAILADVTGVNDAWPLQRIPYIPSQIYRIECFGTIGYQ